VCFSVLVFFFFFFFDEVLIDCKNDATNNTFLLDSLQGISRFLVIDDPQRTRQDCS